MAVKSCSSCGSETLEPGFLAERGAARGTYAQWVRGPLETGVFGGAKHSGRDHLKVHAYRCTRCGRLELFAS